MSLRYSQILRRITLYGLKDNCQNCKHDHNNLTGYNFLSVDNYIEDTVHKVQLTN